MAGYFFKRFRYRLGMSQKELAEKLGVSQSVLSNIEHDKKNIDDVIYSRFIGEFQLILTDDDYKELNSLKLDDVKSKTALREVCDNHGITNKELANTLGYSVSYINNLLAKPYLLSQTFIDKLFTMYNEVLTVYEKSLILSSLDNQNLKNSGNVEFGEVLKHIRKNHHMTRNNMSKILGVSNQYICSIEYGNTTMSVDFFNKYLNKFSYILTEEERKLLIKSMSKNEKKTSDVLIKNFVLANNLEDLLIDFGTVKLSKEEVRGLISETLDKAKVLEKNKFSSY